MNNTLPTYHFFITLVLIINILSERIYSYPNEISTNATDISVNLEERAKIGSKSLMKVNIVNVTAENPLQKQKETIAIDNLPPSDRGFLNWVYPNPSNLKQAYWRFVFDGLIALGTYFQYDTVKRQILITLGRILRQYKIEKAERDEIRKDAALYYNSYNYPYGYQDPAGNQNQVGYKEEKPEYQPSDGDVKEEKPEYQPSDGDVKEEKPEYQPSGGEVKEENSEYQPSGGDVREENSEYQPSGGDVKEENSEYQPSGGDVKEEKPDYQQSTGSELSSYESYDNQLIEKRFQYLGEEKTVQSKIHPTHVKERLISLTNKVCFQKGLCELEKLSSFSPLMTSLWSEIRRDFSSSGYNGHQPNKPRHLNCDKMFASCHVSTLDLINFLLQ